MNNALRYVWVAAASVLEMPEGREVVVSGTLYKEMKLKPSILQEYTKVPSLATYGTMQPSLRHACFLDCTVPPA